MPVEWRARRTLGAHRRPHALSSCAAVYTVHRRQLDLQRKHELIEALQELKMQESDVESWLEEEYQDVLANAGLIQTEIKHQPMRLQVLSIGGFECCAPDFCSAGASSTGTVGCSLIVCARVVVTGMAAFARAGRHRIRRARTIPRPIDERAYEDGA